MSESWTNILGPCLCGKGRVVEHVTESDSVWLASNWSSSATELECTTCSKEWRLNGAEFVRIGSDREVIRIRQERSRLDGELQQIAKDVVDAYFSMARSYPSMKAEWEELRRLGLYGESLNIFRKRKNAGRPVRELVFARWGMPFVNDNCLPDQRERAAEIFRRIEELTAEEKAAELQIERVPFVASQKP
jgi:hypothetical protein